jgi:hypothetical protein
VIEGLWVVQYEGIQGGGGTVMVFVADQVLGGDNGFTVTGEYELRGDHVTAQVTVQNYLKSVPSFFDFQGDYDMRFHGLVDGSTIRGKAEVVGKNITGLAVKMTRVKRLKS